MPLTDLQDWLGALGLPVSLPDLEALVADEDEADAELLATLFLLDYLEQGFTWQATAIGKGATPATLPAGSPAPAPASGAGAFLGISATAIVATAGAKFKADTALQSTARTAYAQGAWVEAQANPATEYLIYKTVGDDKVRATHKTLNGTCLPKTHSWWKTHYPPNGYRCRCRALPLTKAEAEKHGISEQAPTEQMIDYENPATGESLTLPASIQPGWQFGPTERTEQLQALIEERIARFKAFKRVK